ncbi:hypothetical protein ACIGCK_14605 [Microbacterium sp. NPDC078428]|uniref:hypothetical protein n=1 Tax=Microbacterium sp. NPDC078428 TaxID=3364190 RepID=UPI0037CAD0D4
MEFIGSALTRAVAGIVALGLGILLALISVTPAQAEQTIDISFSFPKLLPGVPAQQTGTYQLQQDAELVSVDWINRSGILADALLEIEICQEQCSPPGAGAMFTSGEVDVRVQVTLPADAETNGGQGAATGRLVFTAEENELAVTGAYVSSALLWGIALALVGAVLVALARRRTLSPSAAD